jgi:DNA-binding NarL/FixJ family response regulator
VHTVDHFHRRVLVVEDDTLMGSLVSGALVNEGFDAIFERNAIDAKKTVAKFDPDVVIVDIDLGDGPSGIEFVQMIRRSRPDIAAILLSKHADSKTAGFDPSDVPDGVAFLRKSMVTDTQHLVESIESAIRGHGDNLRHDRYGAGIIDRLTKSQREILHMMAQGLSNLEIAKRRGVSVSNVEQRISEIFKALEISEEGVVPRVEAIRVYISASGVPPRNTRR